MQKIENQKPDGQRKKVKTQTVRHFCFKKENAIYQKYFLALFIHSHSSSSKINTCREFHAERFLALVLPY